MNPPSSRVQVRRIDVEPSLRARTTTRVIRWLFSRSGTDLADLPGLIRLRRRVALMDRVSGFFGVGRTERFRWHRARVNGVRARIVRTRNQEPMADRREAPVLLYLHGGAFLLRALNGHMTLAAGIARTAGLAEAVLPIYRLAPEDPFPAGLDDCFSVYRGLLQRGVPAHRIVLAGDSAGGGLVLKLLMRLRDARMPMPACGILLSPFTDLSCSGRSIAANSSIDPMFGSLPAIHARFYLGDASASDPRCSPLFGDFAGLPPLLAQVGSTERLLDDSLRLAPRVQRAGGEIQVEVWEGMPHVWHAMGLPESTRAIEAVGRFIREHLPMAARAAASSARQAA